FYTPCNGESIEGLYKMGKLIGRGGFGSVFAGRRIRDQLPVATKYLKKSKIRNWDQPQSPSTHFYQQQSSSTSSSSSLTSCASNINITSSSSCINRSPLEINLLSRVNEVSGVIKMLDWFEHKDYYLIVMERPESCADLFDFI